MFEGLGETGGGAAQGSGFAVGVGEAQQAVQCEGFVESGQRLALLEAQQPGQGAYGGDVGINGRRKRGCGRCRIASQCGWRVEAVKQPEQSFAEGDQCALHQRPNIATPEAGQGDIKQGLGCAGEFAVVMGGGDALIEGGHEFVAEIEETRPHGVGKGLGDTFCLVLVFQASEQAGARCCIECATIGRGFNQAGQPATAARELPVFLESQFGGKVAPGLGRPHFLQLYAVGVDKAQLPQGFGNGHVVRTAAVKNAAC